MFDQAPIKKLILGKIYQGMRKLETFHTLDVLGNIESKVASTIAATEKM